MSIDLGRRLIAAGFVSPEEVEAALFVSVVRGVPFPRVLLDRGAITERGLEDELERVGGLGLRQVAGAPEVVKRLPKAMCRRLAALPTRVDPSTGTVDVAAADPLDPQVAAEFGFHLGTQIRVLRAPIAAVEEAIRRLELDDSEPADRARTRRMTPPFPHGAPQSTIPPPPQPPEEAPIPLLRRLTAPASDGGPPRTGGTLVPPSGAPPLAALAIGAPRPVAAIEAPSRSVVDGYARAVADRDATRWTPPPGSPPPSTAPSAGALARPRNVERRASPTAARDGTAPVLTRPAAAHDAEPPSVSFPSMPPTGGRATPAYGTPAYDPGAASGADPATETYRIAPPAEEAYPLREARKPEGARDPVDRPDEAIAPPAAAPPDLRTTMPSAQEPIDSYARPSGPRRASRPVLAAVPYPAAPREPSAPARPEGGRRLRAPDGAPVLEALGSATSRDEVIRIAMRGMRLVARRLAVFVVKRDGFHGWACNAELGDQEALRALHVPAGLPSVLATATATAMYLGPVPPTPAHEGLLGVMDRASVDVACVAVRVAGRAVLVLLCDELEDTMVSTRYLTELAKHVGEALARLLAR